MTIAILMKEAVIICLDICASYNGVNAGCQKRDFS